MEQGSSTIKIFCCYARKDKALLDKFKQHISSLQKQNVANVWHDGNISAGAEWEQEIRDHLNNAEIILLLISPDFINSDYCYDIEMKHALERHQKNETRVIPILLRPVYWEETPFACLQMLPTNAKAITTWRNRDKAFTEVVAGIRQVIEDLSCSTGLSEASMSDKPEPVESSSPARPSTPIPSPPMQKNPLRKKRGLLVAIVTSVVLLGIVGAMIVPMLWTSWGETTAACAAAPTLIEPVDGQTLNSHTVTMTWEAPQGCLPEGYTVRISANYDPEAKPWEVDTGWAPTDYKYTFSADGTYYWHIRACKPCTPFHPGKWVIRSFTIHTLSTS